MRKLTRVGMAVISTIMALSAAADDAPSPVEALKDIKGYATFTADGVNLRMEPSTYAPYLVYASGEELYYEPANVQWSHQLGHMNIGGQTVYTDHEKIQGSKGWALPVIGYDGDWIKLYYSNGTNPFEVWTMKKFVSTEPLVAPTTASTYSPGEVNLLTLTGDGEGSPAIYYQEGGMDEDEGFFIGKKVGNAIVFDHFLPIHIAYDQTKKGIEISKDPEYGTLIFTFGSDCKTGDSDYPMLDVKGFSADNIQALMPLSTALSQDEIIVMLATSSGLHML